MMLAKCLEQRSIHCDYFFMPDNRPLDTETTSSLFMPLWIHKLRKYDFIYCGAAEAAQALYFCSRFIPGVILLDMHGDPISQSSWKNEVESGGKKRDSALRVSLFHRMSLSAVDYVITQSTYQMEDMIKQGVSQDKISVVRNGVDLDFFSFSPQPDDAPYTFGYIGEFQYWQGIEYFIEALEMMSNRQVRILLVGFRERDTHYKRLFTEKLGTRVKLVDRTDRATMIDLMKSVSIFLSPRPYHIAARAAFSTKFAEYAAIGRPILVSRVDETAEFVERYQCGFLCSPTPVELAKAMDNAAEAPWEILNSMSINARSMAESNFAWEVVGDHYTELVLEIVSRNKSKKSWKGCTK
jgi:glycosyltransferase involved in cell wall biosynthesis